MKSKNLKRIILAFALTMTLVMLPVIPVGATAATYPNMAGTWYVSCNISAKTFTGTEITHVSSATIVINTNTTTSNGVIASATITVSGYTSQAVTGFVAKGSKVAYSLMGGGADIGVMIKGTCYATNSTAYKLTGTVTGICYHSQGGTLASDESGTAAYSVADAHSSSVSVLLTQAASAGSTHVDLTPPHSNFKLSQLGSITAAKWGLWYQLENAHAGIPQLELRFSAATNVNPDGAGHVDVTLLTPATGTGLWVNKQYTSTQAVEYYGNDPYDGTAFGGTVVTVGTVLAAINAEGAMTANGGYTANNWVLTRVRVELWDAGVRLCYVDDVMIDGHTFTFEPVQFSGSFSAVK